MISPETTLYVYEVRGDVGDRLSAPPLSFLGIWNEEDFCYLFFTSSEDNYVEQILAFDTSRIDSRHEVKYSDWQTGLPADGLLVEGICFVADDHPEPPPGAILLDPSVVFGDGSHPTTTRCLSFLIEIVRNYQAASLLDLGTGTGILALAAARLGIKYITAIDKNRLAANVAQRNVLANDYSSIIQVREGEARLFIDDNYDIVTANLPFEVLRELVTLKAASLQKFWIVSGISKDQGHTLKELLQEQGYHIRAEYSDHPWVTFVAVNDSVKCRCFPTHEG
ncbi:MAG TPA: 50S ribosomal protein L11 methyltransferase [Desulfomonilaceae bacterium]|nr:50S ribosomal protein L11 methyltransferase [Desulfomonilaceae bacterium]